MNLVPTDHLEQARRFYEFIPRSVDPYKMVAVMEDHLAKAGLDSEALDRTGRMSRAAVIEDIETKITRAATMDTITSTLTGYKSPPSNRVHPFY